MPRSLSQRDLTKRRHWLTLGLPVAASLVVHAFLLGALTVIAYRVASGPSDADLAPLKDVYLALQPPAPSTPPIIAPPTPAPPTPPPPTPPEPRPTPPAPTPEPPRPKPPEAAAPKTNLGPAPAPVAAPTPAPAATPAPPANPVTTPDPSSITSTLGTPPVGVSFAGLKAERARSVVYVVDCSGPMVTTLPLVFKELRRSIEQLEPTQQFTVILFGDATAAAKPPAAAPSAGESTAPTAPAEAPAIPTVRAFEPRLIDATPRAQGRLADWLAKASALGRSNPLEGLRAALALKPQVIFLLSRSIERSAGGAWGAGIKPTLAELDQLNPAAADGKRKSLIKTIQFLEDDPTGTMQAIAAAHGGPGPGGGGQSSYRVMKREELAK